jgi:hypothetical protein
MIDNGSMLSIRALVQLAITYRDLDPQAQAALDALGRCTDALALPAQTVEDRECMEKLERWLQIASLEGVGRAGDLAHAIRTSLFPSAALAAPHSCRMK